MFGIQRPMSERDVGMEMFVTVKVDLRRNLVQWVACFGRRGAFFANIRTPLQRSFRR